MRVFIVDDHALFRRGLSLMLGEIFDDLSVVEAGSAGEAIEIVMDDREFDLVLLDLVMPGMNGNDGLRLLHELLPDVPIIVISSSENHPDVRGALSRGARGYVLKSSAPNVLKHALPLVLSGEIHIPSIALDAAHLLPDATFGLDKTSIAYDPAVKELTPRQTEVLNLLAEGQSNKEIGRNLGMVDGTVKVHTKAIFQKFSVRNRTQAVIAGQKLGYIARADGLRAAGA